MEVSTVPQGHHTHKTGTIANLAKVDLLYCHRALRKCGLFETMENDDATFA